MAHEGYERKRVTNELVKEGLAAGSPFRMRVASGSMIPALRVGDEVVIEKRDWRELRAGDIVLC